MQIKPAAKVYWGMGQDSSVGTEGFEGLGALPRRSLCQPAAQKLLQNATLSSR